MSDAGEEQNKRMQLLMKQSELLTEQVRRMSDYYKREAYKAFTIRSILNTAHMLVLIAQLFLITLRAVPQTLLLVTSMAAVVTFGLLQVIYPDSKIERIRRTAADLSKLSLRMSINALNIDDDDQLENVFDLHKEFQRILFDARDIGTLSTLLRAGEKGL